LLYNIPMPQVMERMSHGNMFFKVNARAHIYAVMQQINPNDTCWWSCFGLVVLWNIMLEIS